MRKRQELTKQAKMLVVQTEEFYLTVGVIHPTDQSLQAVVRHITIFLAGLEPLLSALYVIQTVLRPGNS